MRTMRQEKIMKVDYIHEINDMLDRAKVEAHHLDIPLDIDTCLKQLSHFDEDDFEIREGF